jgi:hypothetical protein
MENFIKSEAGRRLTSVVPRLVAAKDLEKMLEVKGRHFKTSISTKKDLVQMLKLNDEFLSLNIKCYFSTFVQPERRRSNKKNFVVS